MSEARFADRLAERAEAAELVVDPHVAAQLARYFELLRIWNRTINLTALPLEPPTDEAIDRLFVEPLAAARWLVRSHNLPVPQSPGPLWIDLGSGGGSPSIPMKIVMPPVALTMVESKSRKAAFLREAVRALGLDQVAVENSRFEALDDHRAAELLTVRGVRVDDELAGVSANLLVEGGRLAVFHRSAEAPALAGFGPAVIARLIPENPSWLHVYARMFHVEQDAPWSRKAGRQKGRTG